MKRLSKWCIVTLLAVILVSCEKDIIVKDISDKTLTVLAPGDGVNTPVNNVTFWWEEVDGAEKYDVQIVSPTFSNIVQLIADTSVAGDKFTRTLQPGSYQWRIRASNNGGSTPWITRNLTIDTTSNLTGLTVALNSPADSVYTNVVSQTFSWTALSAATGYRFQILNSTGGTVYSTDQTGTSAIYTFTGTDASYTWQVRAENNYSISSYSSRKIFIDVTAPGAPTPYSPVNSFSSTATLESDSLMWVRGSGAFYDSLQVSTDSLFITTLIRAKITGIPVYGISVLNGFLTTSQQRYYWRVKSIDKAGNQSAYSQRSQFKMN